VLPVTLWGKNSLIHWYLSGLLHCRSRQLLLSVNRLLLPASVIWLLLPVSVNWLLLLVSVNWLLMMRVQVGRLCCPPPQRCHSPSQGVKEWGGMCGSTPKRHFTDLRTGIQVLMHFRRGGEYSPTRTMLLLPSVLPWTLFICCSIVV
jgi:hypothetical protein